MTSVTSAPDDPGFWLGLQRERTRLAWNRTLEALAVGQIVVTIDAMKTHSAAPAIVGLSLLCFTITLAVWQLRTSHESHGHPASSPAQRLALTSIALTLLALGGILMVAA